VTPLGIIKELDDDDSRVTLEYEINLPDDVKRLELPRNSKNKNIRRQFCKAGGG
jgi:hypothetical protein